jgi:hypothetical protein
MKLENRLNYNTWNTDRHLVIPKQEVEAYRTWLDENKSTFESLGFNESDMFNYYALCHNEKMLGFPRCN